MQLTKADKKWLTEHYDGRHIRWMHWKPATKVPPVYGYKCVIREGTKGRGWVLCISGNPLLHTVGMRAVNVPYTKADLRRIHNGHNLEGLSDTFLEATQAR